MEEISWTEHNYKLNSAGNDWRRKSPDTVIHIHQERDKLYGTKKETKEMERTWAVIFKVLLLYISLSALFSSFCFTFYRFNENNQEAGSRDPGGGKRQRKLSGHRQ